MVCISILSLSFQLQPPKEDYNICWSENLRLKWDDFQAPPDTTLNVNAQTATNVRTSGYGNSEVPNFRVSNIFLSQSLGVVILRVRFFCSMNSCILIYPNYAREELERVSMK